jgi:methyl-accepting chemotaxis protein
MNKITNKRKWRNYLIRYDVQLYIPIYNLVFLCFVIGAVVATTLVPLYNGFQYSDNLSGQHFSAKFFIDISERLAVSFVVIIVAAFIYNVLVTHRIFGPLVNFNKTFQKITQGNLDCKIYLRRHDYLKSEADQVNEMIDTLSFHFNDLKQYNHLLQKKIEQLMNTNPNLAPSNRSVSEIKRLVEACGETLNHFNTTEISHSSETKN